MTRCLTILLVLLTCLSLTWAGEDRGIGGTGKYANIDDRGIGGTGIIGTITNFGSIWVNGLEVELNKGTQIKVDGIASNEDALRLGQQVKVLAEQEGDTWFAKEILIHHAVIGRIDKILDGSLVIQGMTINQDPNIPGHWPTLATKDYVKVSGYFHDDKFYATDIMPTENDNLWQLTAPVVYDKKDGWEIAGQALPDAILKVKEGQTLTLKGKYTKKGRELTFIRYEESIPFKGQSREYIVEDRGSNTQQNRRYTQDSFEQKQHNFNNNFFERSPITGPGTFLGNPPPAFNGSWENGSWNNNNWGRNSDWSSNWENLNGKSNNPPAFNQQSGFGSRGGFSNNSPSDSRSPSGGFEPSRSGGAPSRGGHSGGPSKGGHSSGGKW
ncbi:DUF5666 domain-containing protein [Marinomonas transparens]|uniref:DUF5666 domain-containing protein n=1 Tax=Marinomonas transparens TaxID=2795388 RepID=A0A934JKT0_9GAMM|nr:DUF5666 domain-containing protein [Marinomonas transparens]MBJ7536203.1 hypothetical protein [Marinomonas transparens]